MKAKCPCGATALHLLNVRAAKQPAYHTHPVPTLHSTLAEPWLLQGTRVQSNALPREATRQAASVGYVGRTLQASRAPPPPPPPPPPDNVRLTVLSSSSSTGPEAMGVNLGHKCVGWRQGWEGRGLFHEPCGS